jgi:hypothetical protein
MSSRERKSGQTIRRKIILKKLIYRAASLKPRDVFDTAAVLLSPYGDSLPRELSLIARSNTLLLGRLAEMSDRYFPQARQMVLEMVQSV